MQKTEGWLSSDSFIHALSKYTLYTRSIADTILDSWNALQESLFSWNLNASLVRQIRSKLDMIDYIRWRKQNWIRRERGLGVLGTAVLEWTQGHTEVKVFLLPRGRHYVNIWRRALRKENENYKHRKWEVWNTLSQQGNYCHWRRMSKGMHRGAGIERGGKGPSHTDRYENI